MAGLAGAEEAVAASEALVAAREPALAQAQLSLKRAKIARGHHKDIVNAIMASQGMTLATVV